MLKRISFISLQSYDYFVQVTVSTVVLEKINSVCQFFFSHQMLLIANYRLSHLKIKMMGAKSPKTNLIAEKKRARKVTGRLWSFSRPSSYPWLQRY